MSYKMLDDACEFVRSIDQSKFIVKISVKTRDKSTHPEDIVLKIQSKTLGELTCRCDTNGEFLDFPHLETLRHENPAVTSNQPKGSLDLSIYASFPVPEDLTFPYSRLGDDIAEANKAIDHANQIIKANYKHELSALPIRVHAVAIWFPKASAHKATVEVESSSGVKTYRADSHGVVPFRLSSALLTENPEVKLSEKPWGMVPDW